PTHSLSSVRRTIPIGLLSPFARLYRANFYRINTCIQAAWSAGRIYLVADLRAVGFGSGSRGPTWVTYSPVTSVPLTTPRSVCSPALEPSFHVNAARPRLSLTARPGVTTPAFAEKLTLASGTGFP